MLPLPSPPRRCILQPPPDLSQILGKRKLPGDPDGHVAGLADGVSVAQAAKVPRLNLM